MPPARPTPLRHALRAAGLLGATAVLSQAHCFYAAQGLSPPHESFYFPTGLAVSPGRNALYVVNSDFDLQYNGGTVQTLDLRKTRTALGVLLARVRCAEGEGSACAGLADPPVDLRSACNGVPYRDAATGLSNGKACAVDVDCASGVCTGATTTADGACAKCVIDGDCVSGGRCLASVCMLEQNTNSDLSPSGCTSLAPAFAGGGKQFATIGAFASGAVVAEAPSLGCVTGGTACSTDADCPVVQNRCVETECLLGGATCATDADCLAVPNHCGKQAGARLFVPVRGDPSITWFDVVDDRGPFATQQDVDALDIARLDCGGVGVDRRCFQDNQIGLDPYENTRSLTLPVEPSGLDVSEDGTAIVTAHQIQNGPAVGLSTNPWPNRPAFQYYLTDGVSAGPIEVAHVPLPEIVKRFQSIAYQPGFLVTYNATALVDLFLYNADALSSPRRPYLTRASGGIVGVNADGKDSRGLVVDPSARRACEASCDAPPPAGPAVAVGCPVRCATDSDCASGGDCIAGACVNEPATLTSCLRCCLDTPLDLYVANRAPPSLLLGHVNTQIVDSDQGGPTGSGVFDSVDIYDTVSLALGPSKVGLGTIIGTDGQPHTRVFVVTFDTKHVFSYDPVLRMIDAVIATGPGPQPIAFDTCTDDCAPGEAPHAYLYIGHFTDSYVGVVDLDARHQTFATMFASIGAPIAPQESLQ